MRPPHAVLLVVAAACAPRLDGTCTVDADCGRSDEFCGGGICLRRSGTSGPLSAEVTSPAPGAQLSRAFRVAAQVMGGADAVTFVVANSATGAPLGQLVLTSGAEQAWSGTLTLDAVAFGGAANVRAIAHRSGAADATSPAVAVVIDQNAPAIAPLWDDEWYARDAGLSVGASVSDDRSGIAAVELQLPDGGVYAGHVAGAIATFNLPAADVGAAGMVSAVPFTLSATDVAGNRASVYGALVHVDDEAPRIDLGSISPTAWFGGPLDLTATIGDGAGSGVATAQLAIAGHPVDGDPPAGAAWTFHADLARLLPGTEAPVTVQVSATDRVGNAGTIQQTILVDTVAPVVSAVQVDSIPDGVDAAGQAWFRGPTVAPGASDVVVSAAVEDSNLAVDGASAPVAIAGGTRYAGIAGAGRWRFAIPRAVGVNATGPIVVTFDAQDLAGNHPVASPAVALYFDDAVTDGFKPAIASDLTWYGRGAGIHAPVTVVFPTPPRSGVGGVVLQAFGQSPERCNKTGPSQWTCLLASTIASAGAESAVAFDVVATSTVGISSTSSGSRNFDDAPPVVLASAPVPYPKDAGPTAWSHDGAHFNVRDSGTLYAFVAWDCGSGVRAASSLSLSAQPSTRAVTVHDSGARQSCANGVSAVVYDVAVIADLSTSPEGAFPLADNVLELSVTVVDGASDGGGGFVQHPAARQKTVAVTRRLWQTPALGILRLARASSLIASAPTAVYALRPADGAQAWAIAASNVLANAVVGGPADAPAVYFLTGSATQQGATLNQVSAADGHPLASACAFGAIPAANCAGGFRTHSASLAVASDGTPVVADNFFVDTGVAGELDCWSASYALMRGCAIWASSTVGHNLGGPFIGRQNHAFFIDTAVASGSGASTTALHEIDLGAVPGRADASAPSCASLDLLTDDSGADAPACGGSRYRFDAGVYTPIWTASSSPARTIPALDLFFSLDGAAHALSTGAAVAGFNGAGAPLVIDSGSTPVLYSATATALSALHIASGGFGSTAVGLPAVPGQSIDDVLLDRSGTLYVASNGQVSAIATSSPGPAGGTAWATRAHDNCRSSNLEFACAY